MDRLIALLSCFLWRYGQVIAINNLAHAGIRLLSLTYTFMCFNPKLLSYPFLLLSCFPLRFFLQYLSLIASATAEHWNSAARRSKVTRHSTAQCSPRLGILWALCSIGSRSPLGIS